MRVKICGITRPEDALLAEKAGADAIGLIFASSKRRVSLAQAARILGAAGSFITRVGVFRDQPLAQVRELARILRLDAVQLHGAEDEAYALALRDEVRVIKAVSFSPLLTREGLLGFPADAILLDGSSPGSGEPFDWRWAKGLRGLPRLILAGGLTPETVEQGIRALEPYGVDVASGVEAAPGVKDAEKVRRFVVVAKAQPGPLR